MGQSLANKLNNEMWAWYAVGLVALLLRYWGQWLKNKNWTRFKTDDALMLFCFGCYTTMMVCVKEYADTNTNYDDPTSVHAFKTARHIGTINVLIETCEVTLLYGVKACFLILYYRLTHHFFQQKVVIGTAVYCVVTYIATIIALYGGFCHPFSGYLVPVPKNIQCVTWFKYNVVELTLNVSSELLIIAIPISVVWNSHMNMLKKVGLCAVFSFGIFTILAACLTKYYVLTNPTGTAWVLWYIREGSMAIIVGNMVLWYPVLRFFFEKAAILFMPLRSFVSNRKGSFKSSSSTSGGSVRTTIDLEAQNGRDEIGRETKWRESVEEKEIV